MAWVRVDDRYSETRKIKRAWRADHATIGLHVMAMSHCALLETDGLVELEWLEERLPDASERASVLEVMTRERLFELLPAGETKKVKVERVRKGATVRITVAHGPRDEDCYLVNDYLEFNESREEAEDRRRSDAERKTRERRKRPGKLHGDSARSPDGHTEDSTVIPDGVHPVSASPTRPDPTRPDPTKREVNQAALDSRRELVNLSERLATAVRANDPKAKGDPTSKAWLDPIRLLLDVDGRSVEEVEQVIDWCSRDEFDSRTVLSPRKLRKRFGELWLKASKQPRARSNATIRRTATPTVECRPAGLETAQAWQAALDELRSGVDPNAVNIWLAPLHPHASGNGHLELGGDPRHVSWARDRFGKILEQVVGKPVEIVACRGQAVAA